MLLRELVRDEADQGQPNDAERLAEREPDEPRAREDN
jgi:hypothetical protein